MSTAIGAALPDLLLSRLDAQRPGEPSDTAVLLSTSDEHGFPHPALLSYAEIDSRGPSMLDIGVYAASVTATNLRRDGRVTLSFVDEQGVWYVKATVAGDERPHRDDPRAGRLGPAPRLTSTRRPGASRGPRGPTWQPGRRAQAW